MGKSVPYVFLAISLIFFLFLVGLTGWRIDSARKTSSASAESHADAIVEQADALRKAGGFDSPYFTQKMRDLYASQPRLLALTIHSQADGILYLISRSKSYVAQPSEVTPDWRGTPEYRYSPGYEELVTRFFPAPDQAISVDALFVIFGREDLFPILRDDLYLLLGFLILCGIFILIASSVHDDRLPGGRRRRSASGAEPPSAAPMESAGNPPLPERAAFELPASDAPMRYDAMREHQYAQDQAAQGQGFRARQGGHEQTAGAAMEVMPANSGHDRAPVPHFQEARPIGRTPPYEAAAPRPPAEAKSLISPESGLVWGEHLEPRLKAEITRAASSDMDLSMALIDLDVPAADPDLPKLFRGVARIVKENHPINDLVFESGRASIAVVMPDMDIDQAVALCEEIRKKVAGSSFDGRTITVSVGASARGGRLIDESALRDEASVSVKKAGREGGNRVIGFRADPAKYRESL